jgi:thiosulfate/3-mercaptopyruvate sulfurtransferase
VRTLLVDCRTPERYAAGHVPGAVHADPERDLTLPGQDPATGGRHPLPSPLQLDEVLAGLGVDDDTFVLACDEGEGWAARCWWLLRHVGHDAAGTLDLRRYAGPLERAAGGQTPGGEVSRGGATRRVTAPRSDDTITAEEIYARLGDPSLVLLDARAPERWRGEVEPLDPVAGRIPGARNACFEHPLPTDLPDDAELAVYCGSGVTACVVVQRLVLAGRERVRMYPGSFSEWCRREGYPIERSQPQ